MAAVHAGLASDHRVLVSGGSQAVVYGDAAAAGLRAAAAGPALGGQRCTSGDLLSF